MVKILSTWFVNDPYVQSKMCLHFLFDADVCMCNVLIGTEMLEPKIKCIWGHSQTMWTRF